MATCGLFSISWQLFVQGCGVFDGRIVRGDVDGDGGNGGGGRRRGVVVMEGIRRSWQRSAPDAAVVEVDKESVGGGG